MKMMILTGMMLCSVALMAQQPTPKHEVVDQMVKSTFYHDNGQVHQQGFYKDGKPHGQWTMFDADGKKVAMGQYVEGQKTGKWFYWQNAELTEVSYTDSRVAAVTKWTNSAVVNVNK